MTTQTQLTDIVYDVLTDRNDVSWEVCVAGIAHLATRWRTSCSGCGQPIRSGAVGVATWCDDVHGRGGHNFQHGCGAWNAPFEVEVDLSEWLVEDTLSAADEDRIRDAIEDGLDRLDDEVAEQRAEEADRVRDRLTRELADVLGRVADGADPEDVATGSELQPGVYETDDGRWVAWDYDPRYHPDDGIIIHVDEDDLPLVGVPEVARLSGLSEQSVRTYVSRGTIPPPLPVVGSDALVWNRAAILAWVADRPRPGRPRSAPPVS